MDALAEAAALPRLAEGEAGAPHPPAEAEATPLRAAAAAAALLAASPDRFSDADLDGLALKLDAHSRQLRGDLLEHLAGCLRRADERQREAVAGHSAAAAQELAAKEQVGAQEQRAVVPAAG